jgi:hypothetical protein
VHRAYAAGRPRPLRFFRSPSQGHAGASGPCQHVGRTDSGLTTLHLAKVRNLKRIVRTLHGIFLYSLIFVCTTLTRLLLLAQNKFKGISSAGRNLANGGRTNKAHEGLFSVCEASVSARPHKNRKQNSRYNTLIWFEIGVGPVQSRYRCGSGKLSPGADVGGVSPVPVQMWQRRASSSADVAGARSTPVQVWRGRAQSWCQRESVVLSPGADVTTCRAESRCRCGRGHSLLRRISSRTRPSLDSDSAAENASNWTGT